MLSPTSPLLNGALDRARIEWLSGDAAAWGRYTACLARLEAHERTARGTPAERETPAAPRAARCDRPLVRGRA